MHSGAAQIQAAFGFPRAAWLPKEFFRPCSIVVVDKQSLYIGTVQRHLGLIEPERISPWIEIGIPRLE